MKLPVALKILSNAAPVPPQPATVALSGAPRGAGFNYAVNGFRGVCILLVFAYHVYNSGLLLKPPYASTLANAVAFFLSSFRFGVELFFMISGYVIVASLRRHRSVGSFLWDRFARIFPVWIPVHVGIFVVGAGFGLKRFHDMAGGDLVATFFANLVLLPPLIPLPVTHDASWSLSYEWLFYLLAAAAVAIAHRRLRATRTIAWLAWTVTVIALLCYLPRALFFIPGALIGLGRWSPENWSRRLHFPMIALLLFLLAWRVVDIDEAAPGAYAVSDFLGLSTLPFTVLSLLLGWYVFACVCADDARVAWLRHRFMQFFGNISYSFYLWHPIVMFAVKRATYAAVVPTFGTTAGLVCFAVVSLLLSVGIALLSYRLFEVRVSKLLRHGFKRRASDTVRVPEAAASSVRPVYAKSGEL